MSGTQLRCRPSDDSTQQQSQQSQQSIQCSDIIRTTISGNNNNTNAFINKNNSNSITTNNTTNVSITQTNQSYYNNSLAIRQEIHRFESVHPSIYAIYDLLEVITDPVLAQQIREHVVCIEDSFVNSQEWTLSRAVPDLRLGIVGSLTSGKSALVHRYLTGSYLQDESPEGGRFKKEVIIDGQSYLLLIRDEGGPPEMQLSCWVDAVIFVFSLENEASFNAIYNYYTKMFHYRSSSDIPIFLVGTQDAISESNPRVIDENRARKLAADLKRCSYYETCATYGLNVEKVFQDACQKIVQSKISDSAIATNNSRPNTPSSLAFYRHFPINSVLTPQQTSNGINNTNNSSIVTTKPVITSPTHLIPHQTIQQSVQSTNFNNSQNISHLKPIVTNNNTINQKNTSESGPLPPKRVESKVNETIKVPLNSLKPLVEQSVTHMYKDTKDLPTPSSTPTTARKIRRRSNLFPPLTNKKHLDEKYRTGEVGSGRAIPVKQGYLYKKSVKTLNKDWKKKYVTLTTDGRLTYHPTLHDYMEDIHGKNIPLKHTTVKIPGQNPRGSRSSHPIPSPVLQNDITSDLNNLSISNGSEQRLIPSTNPKLDTPSVKKRNRRIKNSSSKNGDTFDDSDVYEFVIVSLDNKQWHFDANNNEERECWVSAIELQILTSLQNMESEKSKYRNNSAVDAAAIQTIRTVPGNKHCADCDSPNPDWSTLNAGALICIECSGIHRNLGTHISKVRSLALDDWPPGHMSVMMALGNTTANSIWEFNLKGRAKPTPNSSREEKERWIRAKYDSKEFLAPVMDTIRIEQQLVDAVLKSDAKQLSLILAHISSKDQTNIAFYTRDVKTPLHLASGRGCLAIVQLLLWHNANVKAIDSDGKTALFYAKTSGHKEVIELLVQNGCSEMNGINSNNSITTKRRGSLTALAAKSTDVFDKLPASII